MARDKVSSSRPGLLLIGTPAVLSDMRRASGAGLLGCALLLIAGPSCGPASGPFGGLRFEVLLTLKDAGRVIPISSAEWVGVLLPGKVGVTVSDTARLVASAPSSVQPHNQTFLLFMTAQPVTGRPWTFGGRVTLSSPAVGKEPEWQVTLIIGTDPVTKTDGMAAYASYFEYDPTNLALGQTFSLNWPLGYVPPFSGNDRVVEPVSGIVTLNQGYSQGWVPPIYTGEAYDQQLFAAVGVGDAVLSLPRPAGGGCEIKNTQGACLESPTIHVERRPTWTCSVDDGCTQVNWDGVSRSRPDQYGY